MRSKQLTGKKATIQACHEFADFMAGEIEKLVEEYSAVTENIEVAGQHIVTGANFSNQDNPYRKFVAKKVIDRMKTILTLVIATQRQEHDQLVEIINQLGMHKVRQEIRKGGR